MTRKRQIIQMTLVRENQSTTKKVQRSGKDDMKNDKDGKQEVCEADGKKPGEDAKGCKRDSTVISDNGTTRSENIKRTGERRNDKKREPASIRRQQRPEHNRRHKRRDKKEECCSVQ
ncbi:uncharacterized protein [Ptychodera flava]|uniref:uncharacterized protein n=1 Tax=Ptychodera flava TaxID=63121 RepID=UPI003969FAC7